MGGVRQSVRLSAAGPDAAAPLTGRLAGAERVNGVFAPIPTPFDPTSGDFAPLEFRQNIARLLAEGVNGIVVSGSTGEAALLDADEQRQLVAVARKELSDGAWLIAGTGAESTRQTIALSQAAAVEGANAVLVRPPAYFSAGATPASLARHFRAVADASPVPVLVYNIPKYTHLALEPAFCSSSPHTSASSESRIRRAIRKTWPYTVKRCR